ncbi:MAG: hypothetical protein V1824_03260 [archaeon]
MNKLKLNNTRVVEAKKLRAKKANYLRNKAQREEVESKIIQSVSPSANITGYLLNGFVRRESGMRYTKEDVIIMMLKEGVFNRFESKKAALDPLLKEYSKLSLRFKKLSESLKYKFK